MRITSFTGIYLNTGTVEISKLENDSSAAKHLEPVTSVFRTLERINQNGTEMKLVKQTKQKMFLVLKTLKLVKQIETKTFLVLLTNDAGRAGIAKL